MISISNLEVRRDNFSLSIEKLEISGRKILLIGNNGAGKTTFLSAITGFVDSKGSIKINSKEINDLPIEKRKVSISASSPFLFKDKTVKENLTFPKRLRKDLLDEIIETLDLSSKLNTKAGKLSSGEMQKVSIARCLLSESDLMLFDEPFSYLDQINKMKVRDAIDKFAGGYDIPYIITTNMYGEFLYGFDTIVSIDKGKIIEIFDSFDKIKHFRTAVLLSPLNLIIIGDKYYMVDSGDIYFDDNGYEFEAVSQDTLKVKIGNQIFFIKFNGKIENKKLNFKTLKELEY